LSTLCTTARAATAEAAGAHATAAASAPAEHAAHAAGRAAAAATTAEERIDHDAAEDGAHHVPASSAASAEHFAALKRVHVVLRVLDRLTGELVGPLRVLQGLLGVGRLQLLRLHERSAGFSEPGAGFRADRAAPRDDVVLGRGDLRLRLHDLLADQLLSALRLRGGVAHARDHAVDLSVGRLQALQGDQRPASRARQIRARGIHLGGRRGDRGGDAPIRVGKSGCRGDVRGQFGDQRRSAALALGEVAPEFVDRLLEQDGLPDGLLGRADADRGLAALAGADRGLRGGELLIGERDALPGLVGIVGDGRESLRRVGRRERGQVRVGGFDRGRGGGTLLLHPRQGLGRVLLEASQFVERRGLLIQTGVRLVAQSDDLAVPRPGLLLGVRRRVVQLLLDREGAVEVLPRRGQRLLEFARGGVPELRAGEPELLLARLHGVIGRDESRGGAA